MLYAAANVDQREPICIGCVLTERQEDLAIKPSVNNGWPTTMEALQLKLAGLHALSANRNKADVLEGAEFNDTLFVARQANLNRRYKTCDFRRN